MDKLKPCPFCGGEAITGFAINDYNRWGVECTRCGATVEVADWCGDCDTEENAIKAWNRRVSEASNEVIAKSKPKWIRVEERLPEKDIEVLVFAEGKIKGFFGDTVIAISKRYDFRIFTGSEGVEMWQSPWQYFLTDYEITHWMPLPSAPEPPKEET